jgi:hypothetical protein
MCVCEEIKALSECGPFAEPEACEIGNREEHDYTASEQE